MIKDLQQYIGWFRESSPYIHRFRNQTFVIAFGGEVVSDDHMHRLAQDIALLNSLGINIVLVHGAGPQIDELLARFRLTTERSQGRRITDAAALPVVRMAIGAVRLEIEAALSQGLANSPMEGAKVRICSGNFVLARPLGVLDGVDFQHTGQVRRIDASAIRQHLALDEIVLLSPLGFSTTGEIFNIGVEDIAREAAVALNAAKLIFLTDEPGLPDSNGNLQRQLIASDVPAYLDSQPELPESLRNHVQTALRACNQGVSRVHIVSRHMDGALLLELFSRDGCGTLISSDPFENIRPAGIQDVGGILDLIEPLEAAGVLVKRSREMLEMEIGNFIVVERDQQVIACAALVAYPQEGLGELSCLAVHEDYRRQGRAESLLQYMVRKARSEGLKGLFVLTTQTAHWFLERGFVPAEIDTLPMPRQQLYNFQRRSKVFIKPLA
ncbi:amino-acid N-acetyltransferase [Thermithiobacillus plumbiphilus]|uniref:Amino-acid acetyltransferase n=1 Tax=Thermithiobacillus plumbiphilus TaxID=1729899 RepID=A0ABU9D6B3_9PROT